MSNKLKPDSHAAPLEPTFMDDDRSPLPVPRTAMRYHLNEPCDINAWATSDVGPVATADDASFPGDDRGPSNRGQLNLTTKKELDAMFLPELHQARWAQRMGELRDVQRNAATPEAEAVASAAIMTHYESRHDVDTTRRALEADYKAREASEGAPCLAATTPTKTDKPRP